MRTSTTAHIISSAAHLVGMTVAGPIGGLVGGVAFGLLGSHIDRYVPALSGLLAESFMTLGSEVTRSTGARLTSALTKPELRRINSHLQRAFRQASREALFDIGGPQAFPARKYRDAQASQHIVPPEIIFSFSRYGAQQTKLMLEFLRNMATAIEGEVLLPITTQIGVPAQSVDTYIDQSTLLALSAAEGNTQAQLLQQLSISFYHEAFAPWVAREYGHSQGELVTLIDHLQTNLFRHTWERFNELLKSSEYTPAWRAYQRLVLGNICDELRNSQLAQAEVQQSITQIERLLDNGLDDLTALMSVVSHQQFQILQQLQAMSGTVNQKLDKISTNLEQLTTSRLDFAERPELQMTTGEVLINEHQLWNYCREHWSEIAEQLGDGRLGQALQRRGWNAAAEQVRKARQAYPHQNSAALDALLASADPTFASQTQAVELSSALLDFGSLNAGPVKRRIEIAAISSRYIDVTMSCPPWLTCEPAILTLTPDRRRAQVEVTAMLPAQPIERSSTILNITSQAGTVQLPVRAAITTPDGSAYFYADQAHELVRWATDSPQHWRMAAQWLADDSLSRDILLLWGDARLARRLRHLQRGYPDHNIYLDAALAEIDPAGAAQRVPNLQLHPPVISLAQIESGATVPLHISNPARRLADVSITLPDCIKLLTEQEQQRTGTSLMLRLLPGEETILMFGLKRSSTALGLKHTSSKAGPIVLSIGNERIVVPLRDGIALPATTDTPVQANEPERLTDWAVTNWPTAIAWLFARRSSLADDVEKRWGDSVLAQKIRQERDRGGRSKDAALDAVLALIDPLFAQAYADIAVDPPVLPLHQPGQATLVTLRIRNIGRRHARVEASLTAGWLSAAGTRAKPGLFTFGQADDTTYNIHPGGEVVIQIERAGHSTAQGAVQLLVNDTIVRVATRRALRPPFINAPALDDEPQFARWCSANAQQWANAVRWMQSGRDGLAEAIAECWGNKHVAQQIRHIYNQHVMEPDYALDQVLALLDPHGYGSQSPDLELPTMLDTTPAQVHQSTLVLPIRNNSGRFVKATIQLPPSLVALDSQSTILNLIPGAHKQVHVRPHSAPRALGMIKILIEGQSNRIVTLSTGLLLPDGSTSLPRHAGRQLVAWVEQDSRRWALMQQWLFGRLAQRRSLAEDIAGMWQDPELAAQISRLLAQHSDNSAQALDAVLALLDPTDYGIASARVNVDRVQLVFGEVDRSDVRATLRLQNPGRRPGQFTVEAPAWIEIIPADVKLLPGTDASLNVTLIAARVRDLPQIIQAQLVVRNGSQSVTIQIHATRRRRFPWS